MVQYICVVVAEFNLMRYYVKILHRRKATKEELAKWFKRWKTIGSALSTTRMCLRLGAGIENIGYFLKQLEAYRKNCTIILFWFKILCRKGRLFVQLSQISTKLAFRIFWQLVLLRQTRRLRVEVWLWVKYCEPAKYNTNYNSIFDGVGKGVSRRKDKIEGRQ